MNDNVLIAFALTAFAGLSTGIGSALAFFTNKTNARFLSISLGFSAGVMIYVSFMEIMPKAQEALTGALGLRTGSWVAVGGFFGGVGLIALIDKLVPDYENPHEMHDASEIVDGEMKPDQKGVKVDPLDDKAGLMRMGLMSALAIAIHNFPEGLATFAAALRDPALGIPIAVAVAIHNIPEGIAVSVPIYYSTGSKKKAFAYSFLSGLSEPVGALVGYLLLRQFFNDLTFGVLFAVVAGIMVYISIDELLPASEKYGEHHLSIYGMIAGMGLMALSLLLFL